MNNLRNLRKENGISLAELHRITGYPLRTLEDWEAERVTISSYHRMKKLSEIFDITIDELMTRKEECIFKGKNDCIEFVQDEDGVHVSVSDFHKVIPREKAVKILKALKRDKDITAFLI